MRSSHALVPAQFVSVVIASCLAAFGAARAQVTGAIAGKVVDAAGQAAIKDAVVIAQGTSLQGEQSALTDGTGEFEISLLPAGVYTISVQRDGYRPFSQDRLK